MYAWTVSRAGSIMYICSISIFEDIVMTKGSQNQVSFLIYTVKMLNNRSGLQAIKCNEKSTSQHLSQRNQYILKRNTNVTYIFGKNS
jgi:hypothetical protein